MRPNHINQQKWKEIESMSKGLGTLIRKYYQFLYKKETTLF
jgi:hypothetical protein